MKQRGRSLPVLPYRLHLHGSFLILIRRLVSRCVQYQCIELSGPFSNFLNLVHAVRVNQVHRSVIPHKVVTFLRIEGVPRAITGQLMRNHIARHNVTSNVRMFQRLRRVHGVPRNHPLHFRYCHLILIRDIRQVMVVILHLRNVILGIQRRRASIEFNNPRVLSSARAKLRFRSYAIQEAPKQTSRRYQFILTI